jgi:hypothetical protein
VYRAYRGLVDDFTGLRPLDDAAAASARLASSSEVKKLLKEDERRDEREKRTLQETERTLQDALSETPPKPLGRTVHELRLADVRRRAAPSSPASERLPAERLLAWLQGRTGFYLARDYREQKDWTRQAYVLALTAEVRPESANAAYNLACARALARDTAGAFASLRRAVELGFRDAKLMAEDEDLAALRGDPAWPGLLDAVAKR